MNQWINDQLNGWSHLELSLHKGGLVKVLGLESGDGGMQLCQGDLCVSELVELNQSLVDQYVLGLG